MEVKAKNITAGPAFDVPLDQLNLSNHLVPASGEAVISGTNTLTEIKEDIQLRAAINADELVLVIDAREVNKQQSLDFLDGLYPGGIIFYAPAATDPPGPSYDGDNYKNTVLQMWMWYDESRGKWLGDSESFDFGKTGTVAGGAYFKPPRGKFAADRGFAFRYDGTIIACGLAQKTAVASIIEFTQNGVALGQMSVSASTIVSDNSLDIDFPAGGGCVAVRIKSGSSSMKDVVGKFIVRWRV